MSYHADKQVIDAHTHGHTNRHIDAGNDNTRRPKLASGKNYCDNLDIYKNAYKIKEQLITKHFVQ